jgi:drug/metabolite transporter (DMT)-like permease
VPASPTPDVSRHHLLVAAATLAAASNPVAIKLALSLGFPTFLLGFGRTLCVGLVFAAWTMRDGGPMFGTRGPERRWVVLASAAKAMSVACSFAALSLIPASRVAILSAFAPIANLALVRLLLKDERVTRGRVAGIALGLAGVLVLVALQGSGGEAGAAAAPRILAGDLIAIAGILGVQAMIVFEKKALGAGVSPQRLAAASSVVAVAMFVAAALVLGESVRAVPLTWRAAAVFLYLVAVPGVFLFYVKRWLTSVLDVSYLAAFQSPERALAVALAMVVLGETVSIASFACFGIIVAGTVLATRGARQ